MNRSIAYTKPAIFVKYPAVSFLEPGRALIFVGCEDLERMRMLHPGAQVYPLAVDVNLYVGIDISAQIDDLAAAFLRTPVPPGIGEPTASRSPGDRSDKVRLRELIRERNDWRRRGRR